MATRWTEEEDEYLIENYRTTRYEDLVAGLQRRTASAVRNRICRLQESGDIPETKWWTEEEIRFLCDNWVDASAKAIATHLGRTEWSVIRKIQKLRRAGETDSVKKQWSDVEDRIITDNYDICTLEEIALLLNRSVSSISRRTKALGLKDKSVVQKSRSKPRINKSCPTCKGEFTVVEGRKYCSVPCKQMGTRRTRPSSEELQKLYLDERKTATAIASLYSVTDATVGKWLSDDGVKRRTNREIQCLPEVQVARARSYSGTRSSNHSGRVDLDGQYFRSGWEANLARVFNYQGLEWEFEPKTFIYEGIKRGPVAYTPDFYLPYHPDNDGPMWVEVKGRMYSGAYTKMLNFKRQYPDEFKIMMGVVQENSKAHDAFKRLGIPILYTYHDLCKEYKPLIPEWEGN